MPSLRPRRLAVFAVAFVAFCTVMDAVVSHWWIAMPCELVYGCVLEVAVDAIGVRTAWRELRRSQRALKELERSRRPS
jgi:hypothetical protein